MACRSFMGAVAMNEEMTIQFTSNWMTFHKGDIVRCDLAEGRRLIERGYATASAVKQQKPQRNKMMSAYANK